MTTTVTMDVNVLKTALLIDEVDPEPGQRERSSPRAPSNVTDYSKLSDEEFLKLEPK